MAARGNTSGLDENFMRDLIEKIIGKISVEPLYRPLLSIISNENVKEFLIDAYTDTRLKGSNPRLLRDILLSQPEFIFFLNPPRRNVDGYLQNLIAIFKHEPLVEFMRDNLRPDDPNRSIKLILFAKIIQELAY